MRPVLGVLPRRVISTAVQQYAMVAAGVVAALGESLVVYKYAYPRPLFLLALLISSWGRGLGPSLMGAAFAATASEVFFPEWLPSYGIVSDIVVFGLAGLSVVFLAERNYERRRNSGPYVRNLKRAKRL